MSPHLPLRLATGATLAVLALFSVDAAQAQLLNPCPYTNDGDCDEPEGLNLCAEGTDVADCSNPNANYGSGSGHGTNGLHNPCPQAWLGDGDCDEPEGLGLCAEGTDVADCANPNANFGDGPGYQGAGGGNSAAGSSGYPTAAGGAGPQTIAPWYRVTPNPLAHAGQPMRATPLPSYPFTDLQQGEYTVYHGIADEGLNTPIRDIRTRHITFNAQDHYLGLLSMDRPVMITNSNTAPLMVHSLPAPGHFRVFLRNDDRRHVHVVCLLPRGWPMSECGATYN